MAREILDEDGENKAVRMFLMAYSGGAYTVGDMRKHLSSAGYPYWPEWAKEPGADFQHLTKAGAQDWLRHLFALETQRCHECGWTNGHHLRTCRGYLVDPETGEPIPTHNA